MWKMLLSKTTLTWTIIGFLVGNNVLHVLNFFGVTLLFLSPVSRTHSARTNFLVSNTFQLNGTGFSPYVGETRLFSKQRVLCWIMTGPSNHKSKARAVKDTWAKRCDVTLYMSSSHDNDLPTVKLNVTEGRNQLWGKTREAFRYIWTFYKDEVDWFFKADDDTFAVVENLRYFLSSYNASMAYWFGHRFQYDATSPDFFSGGAGYVLSKEALRRFVEVGYSNGTICRNDHGTSAEDVEIARCLKNLDVRSMDTRDSKGRGRFFPLIPGLYMSPSALKPDDWFIKASYYPPFEPGLDCCSDSAISFHYVEPDQMRLLNYLIYELKHGDKREIRPPTPEPPPDLNLEASPHWQTRQKDAVKVSR